MTDIEIPKIPEVLLGLLGLGLSEFVIIVIGIIILIWAIFWFVIPFYVYGIWRRIKNIEGLIRQQVESRPDKETKKILKEMEYEKGVHRDKDD